MSNNFYTKYEYAQKMLETELNILIDSFERKHGYTPVEHVKTRLKTLPSIQKTLEKKGYSYNVENIEKHIMDVVGFRIVVSFLWGVSLLFWTFAPHSPQKEASCGILAPHSLQYIILFSLHFYTIIISETKKNNN